MFARILTIFLLATVNLFAAVEYDTLRQPYQVKDANTQMIILHNAISTVNGRTTMHRNGGADLSVDLRNNLVKEWIIAEGDTVGIDSTMYNYFPLVGAIPSEIRAVVPETNSIKRMRFYFKTPGIWGANTFRVYAYPILADWNEGSGKISADSSYHSPGGCSFVNRMTPNAKPATPGSPPSSYDWRTINGNLISAVKNQNPYNTCWCFGAIAAVEAVYKATLSGSRSFNSEDSSGADQTVAPIATDTTSLKPVIATGWKKTFIPPYWVQRAYFTSGADCGWVMSPDSGNITIKTAEAGSGAAPRIWISLVTTNGTLFFDRTVRITATNIEDAIIKSGSPTTNFGSDTTAQITTSQKYLFRVDSLKQRIDAAISPETMVSISSVLDSHYVQTVTSNSTIKLYGNYKSKFVESEVTYRLWKATKEWGKEGLQAYDELDLSEQQVISCGGFDYQGGGKLATAYESIVNDSLMTENKFRYTGSAPSCPNLDTLSEDIWFRWFYSIPLLTATDVKTWLQYQPFAIEHFYTGTYGAYHESSTNLCWYTSAAGDSAHAAQLIGYDDAYTCDAGEGTGAWIIKNQYGSDWGNSGFAHVAYGDWFELYGTGKFAYVFDTQNGPTKWLPSDFGSVPIDSVTVSAGSTWYYFEINPIIAEQMRRGNIHGLRLVQEQSSTSLAPWGFKVSDDSTNADRSFWEILSAPTITKLGDMKAGDSRY